MNDAKDSQPQPDWDLTSPEVQYDQRAAYDEMRQRCPVAHSESIGWSLFRHEDVSRVLQDHKTFSNAVSQHLSVPNGMDPPEHTPYRRIIEPYFSAQRMEAFESVCRRLTGTLLEAVQSHAEIEFMAELALQFAVKVQCAFLGWPPELEKPLIRWTQWSQEATRAQDRKVMSEIALEFEGIIDDLLEARERAGATSETDVTAALMREKVWGRPMSNEEIASILRNWTVGEICTISAAVGILAHYLAVHSELQQELRARVELLPPAIDEILRLHGPLVSNRRMATRPVEIGGRKIKAGEQVTLMWIAANRDEHVFDEPKNFHTDRAPEKNLLYGAGIHVCPGAPLARLEMRIFVEELLARSRDISVLSGKEAMLATYPASGFATLPLRIQWTPPKHL